jgi:AraC-like DNA-binding protein
MRYILLFALLGFTPSTQGKKSREKGERPEYMSTIHLMDSVQRLMKNEKGAAIELAEKLLRELDSIEDWEYTAVLQRQLGEMHLDYENEYHLAYRYLTQALKISQTHHNELEEFRVRYQLIVLKVRLGNTNEALEKLIALEARLMENQGQEEMFSLLINLVNFRGNIAHAMGYPEDAICHYEQAIQLIESRTDSIGEKLKERIPDIALNLMSRKVELGQVERESELDLFYAYIKNYSEESWSGKNNLYVIQFNLGVRLFELSHFELAKKEMKKALEIAKELLNYDYEVSALLALAAINVEQHVFSLALTYLQKSENILEDKKTKPLLKELLNGYYHYYQVKGNYKKALEYYNQYVEMEMEVNKAQYANKIKQINLISDLREKEADLQIANKQTALQELEIVQQKEWIFYLLSMVLILLVTTTAVVVQSNKKKEGRVALVRKGLEIQKMNIEKEKSMVFSVPSKPVGVNNEDGAESFTLTDKQQKEIMYNIEVYMMAEKPYLDPDFNMNRLCDKMGINRTYLSVVINQQTGLRFESFTNKYRIDAAQQLLMDEENEKYTIAFLSEKVGFSSQTPFNLAFKKFTGTTPSFFKKHLTG